MGASPTRVCGYIALSTNRRAIYVNKAINIFYLFDFNQSYHVIMPDSAKDEFYNLIVVNFLYDIEYS